MTVTVAYLETKALPHLEYQSVLHYWEVQSYSIGNTSHPSFPVTSAPCQHLAQQQFGYPERNDVIHPQLRVIAAVTQLSLNCLSLRLWLSEMPKHMLALNTGIKPLMSCGGQSRRLVVPSHSRNALVWSLLCFIPYHDKHLALTSALQLKRCNKINRIPPCVELLCLVTPRITRAKRDVKTRFLFPFTNLTAFYVVIATFSLETSHTENIKALHDASERKKGNLL